MEDINYCIMDPTGNITILVETPVSITDQPYVGARIMKCVPEAEQVGFVSYDDAGIIELRMAGGEFCGNASMSAAVYSVMKAGEAGAEVILKVSGASGHVKAKVEKGNNGIWRGTVDMPEPVCIESVDFPEGDRYPVVRFDGIAHIILEDMMPSHRAEALAPEWCSYLGSDAVGLMFLDLVSKKLTPLVYVPAAGTLCWENSCASGTSAVGAYLASGKDVKITLTEPGGRLTVEVSEQGKIRLSGTVRFLGRRNTGIEFE